MADELAVTSADTTPAVDTSVTSDPIAVESTATEVKTEAQTDPAKAEEAKPVEEVEVKYEFDAPPEGVTMKPEEIEAFTALAKEAKLTPDAAKKFMAMAVQREQARIEQHQETVKEWTEQVKSDKELGGDKLLATMALAKKAVALGPPELKDVLNASGLGNHPAIVRWAHSIGKALSEDTLVKGEAMSAVPQSFYPKSNMNR